MIGVSLSADGWTATTKNDDQPKKKDPGPHPWVFRRVGMKANILYRCYYSICGSVWQYVFSPRQKYLR